MSRLKLEIRRGNTFLFQIAFGISLSAFIPPPAAFACGGFFDVACNAVAKAGQDVANAINELQASVLSGPTLERAIVASRNTATHGAMPIPPQIRQQLTGYASEDSMNRVWYKIGDNGFANLAHLLEQEGVAEAVTLVDVVVFRGPSEAADPSIWAHELTHVDQYRNWGVHNFAVSYTRSWQSVEEPAYAKGDRYLAWVTNRRIGVVPQGNLEAFCYPQAGDPFAMGFCR